MKTHIIIPAGTGVTRGVMVGTSAFLPSHQCLSAGLILTWGLNFRPLACGIFWSLSSGVFAGYSGFLPSFTGWSFKNKTEIKWMQLNTIKLRSWAIHSYHVALDMLHVMSAQCVAHDLHTIAPWPLERTCWRQFAALWGDCKRSWIVPFSAIFIIFIIITYS